MFFERKPSIPSKLVEKLRRIKRVAVLTGAGVSAESGVPTFREAQEIPSPSTGQPLWAEYRPEELATPQAFEKFPHRVWEWYEWRRELIKGVEPNPAHYALVEMQNHFIAQGTEFTLITQNVDGLHWTAGSQDVAELHGNIFLTKCDKCLEPAERWGRTDTPPPSCPQAACDGLLRPDVVWFGEGIPIDALHKAMAAAQKCQVFFSIGTSSHVQPAASLPIMALDANAVVVEINPNPTPITNRVTYVLEGLSGEILPQLVTETWGRG